MDKELIWIACRHHMFEIMLLDIFKVVLITSSGPDIASFKRFQSRWMYIDKRKFEPADDNLFTGMPDELFRK